MIVLLAPEKLVTSTSVEEWRQIRTAGLILFTSKSASYQTFLNKYMSKIFEHIAYFHDYPNNDLIELKLLELATQHSVENIIPMTEADVLRVSKVKAKLGMQGLSYADAILFRDKIVMKERAQKYHINVPQFKHIQHTIDLLEFIEKVGYPIIIKPILGRGSLNTTRVSSHIH
jgi:biotin carboxylase